MRTQLRRIGVSSGVIIPEQIMAQLGVEPGAELELTVEGDRIVITSATRHGWAEAASAIATAGDDTPEWDGFDNAGDAALTW